MTKEVPMTKRTGSLFLIHSDFIIAVRISSFLILFLVGAKPVRGPASRKSANCTAGFPNGCAQDTGGKFMCFALWPRTCFLKHSIRRAVRLERNRRRLRQAFRANSTDPLVVRARSALETSRRNVGETVARIGEASRLDPATRGFERETLRGNVRRATALWMA